MIQIIDANGRRAMRYTERERELKTLGYFAIELFLGPVVFGVWFFVAGSYSIPGFILPLLLFGALWLHFRKDFHGKALEVWTHNDNEDLIALYLKTGNALPMLSR